MSLLEWIVAIILAPVALLVLMFGVGAIALIVMAIWEAWRDGRPRK